MDRALFGGDEPSNSFKTISCFLFFNFEFYCLQRLPLVGQPSCKCVSGCWQPSGKSVTRGQRVLAILWQLWFLGFHRYCQTSDKFLRGNCQLLQIAHICQRVANTLWSFAWEYWILLPTEHRVVWILEYRKLARAKLWGGNPSQTQPWLAAQKRQQ
jgi:hypothetical protein